MKKIIILYLFSIFIGNIPAYSQSILNTDNPAANEKLMHPAPVPYFAVTGLCLGDTTHFINKTQATLISLEWNILNDKGDTLYHAKTNNLHYYFKKRGFYSICLTVNNGHIATKTRVVRVDNITKAGFAFRSCYDEFDNLSACSEQFIWVLPDMSLSTDTFPAYKFSAPGKYSVKLVAKKGNKSDTLIKLITIKGDSVGIPIATFTCKRVDTSATFEFTAQDSLANSYSWYFGDKQGDDTTGYKVRHTIDRHAYSPPVNLFVTNGCGIAVDMLDPFIATELPEEKKSMIETLLYPNPAENELLVVINGIASDKPVILRLMNSNGLILKEKKLQSAGKTINFNFNLQELSKGIYIMQIETGQEHVNRKFIIR